MTVVAVPKLAHRFLITPDSKVLLVGTLVFEAEAIYANVANPFVTKFRKSGTRSGLHFSSSRLDLSLCRWSLPVSAVCWQLKMNSRLPAIYRLRFFQGAILKRNLRITAAYHPMTAVAGDFYDFIPVDQHRVGVLVADVLGHGIPAALIAAMIKMAAQSIVPCVQSPGDLLQGLNRMLYGQAPDQFATAAYLFIDTQNYSARYSAAGHPPLLLSRAGTLQRIESNGLVFGVMPQPDYPVRDIPLCPGDRLLLYTDGVIEPENAKGKPFGDSKLEQVVLGAQKCPPSELTDRLLTEIRAWQPASMAQQDDITLVVIDVR